MSDTGEATELADIQTFANPDNIPLGELRRLLDLNDAGTLHNKQTVDEYLNSGIHSHRVMYYGDPIDMVKTREKQGLPPKAIDCVKTSVHHFDVAQFNKQLLKRANREASRGRQHSIIVIRQIDEQAAKEIIAKTEEKLLTLEKRDKPAIASALLALSIETRLVQDDVIENLQAIGYITLDEKDGETSVSYKLTHRLGEFVKRMLQYHNLLVTSCCNSPNDEWDGGPGVFQSEVRLTCINQKLEQTGLELLKPECLLALELLEHMWKSRPKTLKSLERIIQPVVRSVAITPMNMTFAKLVDMAPTLKAVTILFVDPSVFPFSLSSKDMFVVPWKAGDDASFTEKETKRFCQKVFSNFRHTRNEEKYIQHGLTDAATQAKAVKSLQQWLENREKGIASECEKKLERCNAISGILNYKLSCLTCVEDLTPLTREDIYGILARMPNVEVTYSQQEVVERLEELGAFKAHPDKVIFFVKTIRRLVNQAEAANKKVISYVSNSLKRYYPAKETKKDRKSVV